MESTIIPELYESTSDAAVHFCICMKQRWWMKFCPVSRYHCSDYLVSELMCDLYVMKQNK